jgi:uncharacterized membrane protein
MKNLNIILSCVWLFLEILLIVIFIKMSFMYKEIIHNQKEQIDFLKNEIDRKNMQNDEIYNLFTNCIEEE